MQCSGSTPDVRIWNGVVYNVKSPNEETTLVVTENERAVCCGNIKHATIADRKKDNNIIPFHCNCDIMPHNDEEWGKLKADSSCREEGTCKALMNLNNKWDNLPTEVPYLTFSDDEYGKISGINMTSILFCKHGGIIRPITSGQEVYVVSTREKAIETLRKYLQGEYGENQAEDALIYLAGQSTCQLQVYKSGFGCDYNKYDSYILGWTEYYNEVFQCGIDPKLIKSQCYEESGVGESKYKDYIPTANPHRDIMQALDVRNDNIYYYIGISTEQFEAYTSYDEYWSGTDIWNVNHEKGEKPPEVTNPSQAQNCGGIIATLFTENKDGTGEVYCEGSGNKYYYQHELVTPIMSIGVGMDRMREELQNNGGNYRKALEDYNNAKNPSLYANNIITRSNEDSPVMVDKKEEDEK